MAHYGRYLFHFQNVTFNVTFPKVAFCRQEYPAFYPIRPQLQPRVLDALAASSRLLWGVFRVPLDGQSIDRPGAAVPGYLFPFDSPPVPGRWSAVPVSCPRLPVQAGRWSTCPDIGAVVHTCGSAPRPRLPGSGCLLPVCNLSVIAPDLAILNPVYFLLYVDFWNMVFLEIEKLIF